MTAVKDWVHRQSLLIVLMRCRDYDQLQYNTHRDTMYTMIHNFCTFEDSETMLNPKFIDRTPQLSMITDEMIQAYQLVLKDANPIDSFVGAKLADSKLSPNPISDRRTRTRTKSSCRASSWRACDRSRSARTAW